MVSSKWLTLITMVPLYTRAFHLTCTQSTSSFSLMNKFAGLQQRSRNLACKPFSPKMVEADIELRLQEKNIVLPDAAPPAANYVPYVVTGNYIYVAGQIPLINGELMYKGKVSSSILP
jgi:hypothetical protein